MSTILNVLPGAAWLPFLAALAAKATLVLLLTAIAAALLWRSSAAVRHMVWCTGVAGVLALPVISAVTPAWNVPLLPAAPSASAVTPAPAPAPTAALPSSSTAPTPLPSPAANLPSTESSTTRAAGSWLPGAVAGVAAGGVLIGLLWLAAGFWGVARLGRSAEVVSDAGWLSTAHHAAERLGLRRPVLLLRSRGTTMPATWGLLWPSVVLPAAAEQWPADRRHAVLAHELAHVKRFDCLTQALAQVACVLLWWHPAVWYAARRLRVERERACDDLVLGSGARPSDYAAHLLEIARAHRTQWMASPAMVSMARPSQLESRLLWVLDGARARTVPSARAALLAVGVGMMVVAPLAAMRPVPAAAHSSLALRTAFSADAAPLGDASAAVRTSAAANPSHAAGRMDAEPGTAAPAPTEHDAVKADERHPVAAGDTTPNRSVEDLIGMRAVGVDAAYIAEMRAVGYSGLSAKELTSLRAVGVTGAYARTMTAAFGRVSADDLEGMRAVGVTPAFLNDLASHGYARLTAGQATGLRAVGVNGAYVDAMNRLGFGRLTLEQIESLRALGVTPASIAELGRAGITARSLDELESLRALGVSGEYVRELASVGLNGLTTGQLVDLKAQGVTADYVRELRAAGIATLTPDQLVRLKVSGVDRDLMRARSRP